MSDATLNAWLCLPCQVFNLIGPVQCRHCHRPIPDVVTIHEIGITTPAAMELLEATGKTAKKAAKGAKSGEKKAGKKDRKPSSLEWQFETLWRETGYPMPSPEYRFHPKRRWRFDYAWSDAKIAIECEGGTWGNGRHNRGKGYAADCEKYNQAILLGWRVLRFTKIDSNAIEIVETLYKQTMKGSLAA
jgi:hypothetical protein